METMYLTEEQVKSLWNYDWVQKRLGFKVINLKDNCDKLKDIPYISFFDLAAVVILYTEEIAGCSSTMMPHNALINRWGVSKERLFHDAMENMERKYPVKLQTMNQVLHELTGVFNKEDIENPMYVLTNSTKQFGASSMLYKGMMKDCARKLGGEFYIIPSSIHELILVPEAYVPEPVELIQMLRDINRIQVMPEEVLSDCIYRYEPRKDVLSMLNVSTDRFGKKSEQVMTIITLESEKRSGCRIVESMGLSSIF